MIPPAHPVFGRTGFAFRVLCPLALALIALILPACTASPAYAASLNATSVPSASGSTDISQSPFSSSILIEGYVTEAHDIRDRPGVLIPVPGAKIYFIRGNQIVATATSNAVGYYSVKVSSGDYSVAIAATGFQTLLLQESFDCTRTFNIGLTPVPFNGFVPYALYPVLETSPGREVECTLIVENFQVVDQMVTFTVVTPPEWQAWFPSGEAMMIRSGDSSKLVFTLKYTGSTQGAHTIKVVVNGGTYFAEVPVVIIIKDLPFESLDFYANSPQKTLKPGNTADFTLTADNKYAQGKNMDIKILDMPRNWSATTGNGTAFFVPDGRQASTHFYVYVPGDTRPGNYTMNVSLTGKDVKTAPLALKVMVEAAPLYDAIIKSYNRSADGYPLFNVSNGSAFEIPVRVYNSWDFPVSIQSSAQVADNWPCYVDGLPGGRIRLEPHKAVEFAVKTAVPNGTCGNFTARVYLESEGRDMTLISHITVPPPAPSPTPLPSATKGWEGPALTGVTAGAILITLGLSLLRKLNR